MIELISAELYPRLLKLLSSVVVVSPHNLLPRRCLLAFHWGNGDKIILVKKKKKSRENWRGKVHNWEPDKVVHSKWTELFIVTGKPCGKELTEGRRKLRGSSGGAIPKERRVSRSGAAQTLQEEDYLQGLGVQSVHNKLVLSVKLLVWIRLQGKNCSFAHKTIVGSHDGLSPVSDTSI